MKIFTKTFWIVVFSKLISLFPMWVYADPGLVSSYFPFIFMYQVFKGTAEDAAITLTFAKTTAGPPLSKAISVYAFDNACYIKLSYDGTTYSEPIEIMVGEFFHFSQTARKVQIYNQTAGQISRFQLIAWYVISQY
jgi:hypothetical protein